MAHDYWSPESICAKLKPARPDATERVLKSGTGNAAKDGYTAGSRRMRDDIPGEMVSREEAERREEWEREYGGMGPVSMYDD